MKNQYLTHFIMTHYTYLIIVREYNDIFTANICILRLEFLRS